MSKRAHSDDIKYIVKKIRKIEKKIRRRRHQDGSSPSSSSASSSSSSRSSPSPDNENEFEASRDQVDTQERPDVTARAGPSRDNNEPQPPPASGSSRSAPKTGPDPAPTSGPAPASTTGPTEAPIITPAPAPTAEPAPVNLEPTNIEDPNSELLDILGDDPSISIEFGPELHKEIASRFTHISTTGLNKETKKELIKKHLIPINCKTIAAPQLNAEIKATVTEQVLKRDKAIEARQKQLAATITSLGKTISDQLNATTKNNSLIKDLMDTGRLLCDLQYSESVARRNFALYSVKKELKDQLSNTKIDKLLFGENLNETLKSAKAVCKSSSDLKIGQHIKRPSMKPSSSKNWKARSSTRRQPTTQAPRLETPASQPASAPPRGNSSQPYMQRFKQTRRQ